MRRSAHPGRRRAGHSKGGVMRIGVPRETAAHARRVALVPEAIARLAKAGHTLAVQRGAGVAAGFPDAQYQAAGASIVADGAELLASSELVLKVQRPSREEAGRLSAH